MNRRELFPILGSAAAIAGGAAETAKYQPRTLSAPEFQTVTALANLILPADESSAGAGDAGAAFYIDTILFHSPSASQAEFRTGLKPLVGLDRAALDHALAALDGASDPFFRRLKFMVVDAYCLSPEAKKFLRYSGDSAAQEFKGCDHPEHHKV